VQNTYNKFWVFGVYFYDLFHFLLSLTKFGICGMYNVCISNIVSVFFILIYIQLAHMPILLMGCYYIMTKNKIVMHCYCVLV